MGNVASSMRDAHTGEDIDLMTSELWRRIQDYVDTRNEKLLNSNRDASLPEIKRVMNICQRHPETIQIQEHVNEFMEHVCRCLTKKYLEHLKDNEDTKLQLVGSAKEKTRPFLPDEYDYVIVVGHSSVVVDQARSNFYRMFKTNFAVLDSEIGWKHHYLTFVSHSVGSFVKLDLVWNGQIHKGMIISVDLVPVIILDNESSINRPGSERHHRFLDDALNYHRRRVIPSRAHPWNDDSSRLFPRGHDPYDDSSELENSIILNLPEQVRNGYKLAKAVRIGKVVKPVYNSLKSFLNAYDICDIIKSYMFKTCLLFITQDLDPDDESTGYSDVYWAMLIYGQLLKFILDRRMPSFFDQKERIIMACLCYPRPICASCLMRLAVIGAALQLLRTGHPERNLEIIKDDFLSRVERCANTQLPSTVVKGVLSPQDWLREAVLEPFK